MRFDQIYICIASIALFHWICFYFTYMHLLKCFILIGIVCILHNVCIKSQVLFCWELSILWICIDSNALFSRELSIFTNVHCLKCFIYTHDSCYIYALTQTCCILEQDTFPPPPPKKKSTGNTQEAVAPSRHV